MFFFPINLLYSLYKLESWYLLWSLYLAFYLLHKSQHTYFKGSNKFHFFVIKNIYKKKLAVLVNPNLTTFNNKINRVKWRFTRSNPLLTTNQPLQCKPPRVSLGSPSHLYVNPLPFPNEKRNKKKSNKILKPPFFS